PAPFINQMPRNVKPNGGADGVGICKVEPGIAVEPLRHGRLIVPTNSQVQGKFTCHLPIVLKVQPVPRVRVHGGSVDCYAAVGVIASPQQKGSKTPARLRIVGSGVWSLSKVRAEVKSWPVLVVVWS